MAFAVSKWPYTPDPRQASFDNLGWDYGEVPPWQWVLQTTGATGVYAIFNAGVMLEPFAALATETLWREVIALPDTLTVILSSLSILPPAGGPPLVSKRLFLRILSGGFTKAQDTLDALFPTAIAVQTPFDMVVVSPPVGTIPNKMELTPAKWNAVL